VQFDPSRTTSAQATLALNSDNAPVPAVDVALSGAGIAPVPPHTGATGSTGATGTNGTDGTNGVTGSTGSTAQARVHR
jgi:hypothetical protein